MPTTLQLLKEFKAGEFDIPEHLHQEIDNYINNHVRPGNFLSAIIFNELRNSVELADFENIGQFLAYLGFFKNHAPKECWGSREAFTNWLHPPAAKEA